MAQPVYARDILAFVEDHLDDNTALTAALLALLVDPASYPNSKGQPSRPLVEFVHELTLSNQPLRAYLDDPATPLSRRALDSKFCPVWRGARQHTLDGATHEFDLCISFAGDERPIAKRIAERVAAVNDRRVFYDDFEKTWGEDLFAYLYSVYSERSRFCVILFSYAYLERAWTRHELRAAQTRLLRERSTYVLPVAVDSGAVPPEFAATSYWPFKPGDEERIAEAVEQKINDFLGRYYLSVEEITDLFNRDMVASAVLEGFRVGIGDRLAAGDDATTQELQLLCALAIADLAEVTKEVRAAVELTLFSPGRLARLFGQDNAVRVFGRASIRRRLGAHGPLVLSREAWEEHVAAHVDRVTDAWANDDE